MQGSPMMGAAKVEMKRVLCFYHALILKQAHPHVGQHADREMVALAEIIDCFCEGDLSRLGDVALQRYKVLELSVEDGSWDVSQVLEVLEHARSALAADEQRIGSTS